MPFVATWMDLEVIMYSWLKSITSYQKKKKIRPMFAENTSECVFKDGATQIIHFYFLHGWLSERILVCGQSELRVGRAL